MLLTTLTPCLYTEQIDHEPIIIFFWVDDIVIGSNKLKLIYTTKQPLQNKFEIDDRGELRWFLGIDLQQLDNGIIT